MSEHGTSVTLIFYKISTDSWYKEPALNLLAAAAQLSSYTHVEIAVGEDPGSNGMMRNVCRVYNDNVGVVRSCEQTASMTHPSLLSDNECAGAVRADRKEPPEHVSVARVLKGAGAEDAVLCAWAGWKTVLQQRHGTQRLLSEADDWTVVLLRRCDSCGACVYDDLHTHPFSFPDAVQNWSPQSSSTAA